MFTPIRISLKKPLTHGNETITDLVIGREMVAGDLRGIEIRRLIHDDVMEIGSRLTGVPTPVLRNMSLHDYGKLSEAITVFFGDGPETGNNA
jgi:hypothetical protein